MLFFFDKCNKSKSYSRVNGESLSGKLRFLPETIKMRAVLPFKDKLCYGDKSQLSLSFFGWAILALSNTCLDRPGRFHQEKLVF